MKEILELSVPGLKGKIARIKKEVVQPDMVAIPNKHIQDYYINIKLTIDIIHVNQISFLVTISGHTHYHSASVLPSMNRNIIVAELLVPSSISNMTSKS